MSDDIGPEYIAGYRAALRRIDDLEARVDALARELQAQPDRVAASDARRCAVSEIKRAIEELQDMAAELCAVIVIGLREDGSAFCTLGEDQPSIFTLLGAMDYVRHDIVSGGKIRHKE